MNKIQFYMFEAVFNRQLYAVFSATMIQLFCFNYYPGSVIGGGGATRSLPRDGATQEFRRNLTVRPRSNLWTRDQNRRISAITVKIFGQLLVQSRLPLKKWVVMTQLLDSK